MTRRIAEQAKRIDELEAKLARKDAALEEARDCLSDMHESEGCKFKDPNAEGCMACLAFDRIAAAEEADE